MGLRIRLGGGFTYGRSGLRFGHRIGKTYMSVGRSGTLLSRGRLRYWAPASRGGGSRHAATRCLGVTRAGSQCTNSATQGVVCRRHLSQAASVAPVIPPAPPQFSPALSAPAAAPRSAPRLTLADLVMAVWVGLFAWGVYACLTNPANRAGENIGAAILWAVIWLAFSGVGVLAVALVRAAIHPPR